MAQHHHDGRLYEYRLWPIALPTPRWFDDLHGRHPLADLWAWMRSAGLIRVRDLGPDVASTIKGGLTE